MKVGLYILNRRERVGDNTFMCRKGVILAENELNLANAVPAHLLAHPNSPAPYEFRYDLIGEIDLTQLPVRWFPFI